MSGHVAPQSKQRNLFETVTRAERHLGHLSDVAQFGHHETGSCTLAWATLSLVRCTFIAAAVLGSTGCSHKRHIAGL